jgi:drug/metabolite transporter (DMT)-like permease
MSLESVFAVLAGWVLLGQTLSPTEALGSALVFAGVLLSQRKST